MKKRLIGLILALVMVISVNSAVFACDDSDPILNPMAASESRCDDSDPILRRRVDRGDPYL